MKRLVESLIFWRKRSRFDSSAQARFNAANERAWRSGYFEKGNQEKTIRVEFSNSNLRDEVLEIPDGLPQLGVVAVDRSAIENAQKKVRENFKEEIKNGRLGGTGGGGVEGFFSVAEFALAFVFNWSLGHILADLDDAVWKTLKGRMISLYRKLLNSKPEQAQVAIVASSMPHERDLPTVVFVFPSNITVEEFSIELDKVAEITKRTKVITGKEEEPPRISKFTLNQESKEWESEDL